MIAGASWMCCILSITEDGKQPEQPRSRTSRQFSISAVKLKTAASYLRNYLRNSSCEQQMGREWQRYEGKKKKSEVFYAFGQLPAVISLHFYYSSAKSETADCTWAAPAILGNLGKSKWAERGGPEVIPHPGPFIPEWNGQGPWDISHAGKYLGYFPVF